MDVITFKGVKEAIGVARNARRSANAFAAVMAVFLLTSFLFVVPLGIRTATIFTAIGTVLIWVFSYAFASLGGTALTANTDVTDTRVWTRNDWWNAMTSFRGSPFPRAPDDYSAKQQAGMLEVDDDGLRLLVFLKWKKIQTVQKRDDNQVTFTKKSPVPFLSDIFDLRTMTLRFQSPEDAEKFLAIANEHIHEIKQGRTL